VHKLTTLAYLSLSHSSSFAVSPACLGRQSRSKMTVSQSEHLISLPLCRSVNDYAQLSLWFIIGIFSSCEKEIPMGLGCEQTIRTAERGVLAPTTLPLVSPFCRRNRGVCCGENSLVRSSRNQLRKVRRHRVSRPPATDSRIVFDTQKSRPEYEDGSKSLRCTGSVCLSIRDTPNRVQRHR